MPNGDVAVFAVTAVRSGTMPTTPDAAQQLSQQAQRIAGESAGVEFSAYLAELVRTAKVKINDKIFE
jgi:hypothetical protein